MAYRGPFADVEIDERSLPAFVLDRAAELGDRPALIDGPSGRTITYAGLAGAVQALAGGLAARGFGPGDVFAIFTPNVPEYAIVFHGTLAAGAATTTVNSLASQDDVERQLKATGARFLLTVEPFLERAVPAATGAGVEEVFVLGEASAGTRSFAELLTSGAEPPNVSLDPAEALAALPMSSGTTGFPKVVQLTHRNLVANVIQANAAIAIEERDVLIGVLPFFQDNRMAVSFSRRNGISH